MNLPIPSFKNTYLQLGLSDSAMASSSAVGSNDCPMFLSEVLQNEDVFLTKSCTQSLELAIMILDLPANSEVILPSYGFVSLANAVAICGHTCVFVDCEADTLNISADAIEAAVSPRTKAVITINYGGVSCCDYERIRTICDNYGLWLIEDNAHGLFSHYKGLPLGSFGDISTFSFDSLKMITCFEGGALAINNRSLIGKAFACLEMGTNKADFRKGKVPYYEWTSLGTNSNLASPLQSILEQQIEHADKILNHFTNAWNYYYQALESLAEEFGVGRPMVTPHITINGYIFWIMTHTATERTALINRMENKGITLSPHYSALHISEYGKAHHVFRGEMINTEKAVEQMVRLPLFYGITQEEQNRVITEIEAFYAEQVG